MNDIKAFGKWSTDGVVVKDPGLKAYITLLPRIVPRTHGRNVGERFYKSKNFIIERLMNKIMVPGHKGKKHFITSKNNTGKAHTVYNIIEKVLAIIEEKTGKNPIQVLVTAIENAAPREEILTIEYGGARYPKAVECSPQRRIDLALKFMVQGSYQKSFGKKKKMYEALSEEILNAYNDNPASAAISKKIELERQADSSR